MRPRQQWQLKSHKIDLEISEGGKGFSVTRELAIFSLVKREIKILIHVNRDLANYFSVKREIKNLIHVNRDQGLSATHELDNYFSVKREIKILFCGL